MLDFQRGSPQAFDELSARYREPIHGFFRRRLESDERAEDLAQETFVAVIRASVRYEPRSLFRTYLYGIALRLLAAERRKQARNRTSFSDEEPAMAQAEDRKLWVRESLAKLEFSEREILMLREYEQLSYAEIAELLRIPVNTVRSRLFRARSALKEYLEAQAELRTAAATSRGNGEDIKGTEDEVEK
jgi:RNA polymerase sigma-70 factor, ECF subfamily